MMTSEHQGHINTRISHNACPECRADNERSFVRSAPFKYEHVNEYLGYIRPRLHGIRTGAAGDTSEARIWYRRFIKAMNRRISSHIAGRVGRKYSDGYLERLKMANVKCGPSNHIPSAFYLRSFAARGASCLDR